MIVAGSLGPTGGLIAPYGPLDAGAVRAAYAEEAASLVAAGVDVLWVETMMDLREAVAAVDGARDAAPHVPVVATLVFTRGRTMFGDRPADVATTLAEHGVAGVGANCGDGFGPVEEVIPALAAAAPGLHVIAKANAGVPVIGPDGRAFYPGTADEAARLCPPGGRVPGRPSSAAAAARRPTTWRPSQPRSRRGSALAAAGHPVVEHGPCRDRTGRLAFAHDRSQCDR